MRTLCRVCTLSALFLTLSLWWSPENVPAQATPPKNAALIEAVTSDPSGAPQLTAREVAAGTPNGAPPIIGDVVGALPSGQRLSLAPRVVSFGIAALPVQDRTPQAPACACAAIGAVPASERLAVVPAIVAAAVAMAPAARLQIAACAIEAAPELAAAITAAAGPLPIQRDLASPPTSPLPGSTIGRDVLFSSQTQSCASPPCP